MFTGGAQTWKFVHELEALVDVLAPMAKSITCLESTHSTISDVYLFWLACMASIHDIIVKDRHKMGVSVTEGIRRRMNSRWLQMIGNAPHDIYFTGFVLDPRKSFYPSIITELTNSPQDTVDETL